MSRSGLEATALSPGQSTFRLCPLRTIEPEALRQGNMSSLGFTSKEQRNLGLLVHLMTSNPKILYAPVGTEVDKVILKVGGAGDGRPLRSSR